MMEKVSIKHCDWLGSHYHGAQEMKLKTTLLEQNSQ